MSFNTSRLFRAVGLSATLLSVVACAPAGTNIYQDTAVGGVGAGIVGASTGAAIGAVIKNGDVAKSALLGTALAVPVGMALGAAYSTYSQNAQIKENNELIQQNHQELVRKEEEIEGMRRSIEHNSGDVQPSFDRIEPVYTGQTLGNPFR